MTTLWLQPEAGQERQICKTLLQALFDEADQRIAVIGLHSAPDSPVPQLMQDADTILLSASPEILCAQTLLDRPPITKFSVCISVGELLAGLYDNLERRPMSDGGHVRLPMHDNPLGTLVPVREYRSLFEGGVELLHLDWAIKPTNPQMDLDAAEEFYRGQPPSAANLALGHPFRTKAIEKLETLVNTSLHKQSLSIITLSHMSGCGGTTAAMVVAHAVRKHALVAVIRRTPSSDVLALLEQHWRSTKRLPLLLVVDPAAGTSVDARFLCENLAGKGCIGTLVVVSRKYVHSMR
jgi:hypothetical protein